MKKYEGKKEKRYKKGQKRIPGIEYWDTCSKPIINVYTKRLVSVNINIEIQCCWVGLYIKKNNYLWTYMFYTWYYYTVHANIIFNVTQKIMVKQQVNSEPFTFSKKFLDKVKNIVVFTLR